MAVKACAVSPFREDQQNKAYEVKPLDLGEELPLIEVQHILTVNFFCPKVVIVLIIFFQFDFISYVAFYRFVNWLTDQEYSQKVGKMQYEMALKLNESSGGVERLRNCGVFLEFHFYLISITIITP